MVHPVPGPSFSVIAKNISRSELGSSQKLTALSLGKATSGIPI